MADFDPDAYLAQVKATKAFDPDSYLTQTAGPDAEPTLGAGSTGLFHFARHIAGGLGDKIIAAEAAASDLLHRKQGHESFGDAYNRNLAFNDKLIEASDKAHPVARWVGNVPGVVGSALALGGAGEGLLGATGIGAGYGAAGGFGGSRAADLKGTLKDTALGAGIGAAGGAAMHSLLPLAGQASKYLGNKAGELAGWLKVNSLHPTPALGKAMEMIPGGKVGVGKELLKRGIGGWTKGGTLKQTMAALEESTKPMSAMAEAYDAAGKPLLDLAEPLDLGGQRAAQLLDEPTTETAGNQLRNLLSKYEVKYGAGESAPTTAVEALQLKRALGKEAYGTAEKLAKSGGTQEGPYGQGVSALERGVDSGLDRALGPNFEAANTSYRRMLGASQAAETQAARGAANHILGLLPHVAGAGAISVGHGSPTTAIATGLATALLGKYGSQFGARSLYRLGQGLEMAPNALGSLAEQFPNVSRSLINGTAAPGGNELSDRTRALIQAIRGAQ